MTVVGIRERRDHLSRYLERVQAGEEVVVTDRGRAVCRVLPMNGERTIDRLIREGTVTPAKKVKRPASQPIKTVGPVSGLVAEQRR